MKNKPLVIGSGIAGMSAAAVLAQNGCDVQVFEKNRGPGGRCTQSIGDGFTFDMGPSWYWMPDVMERFFNRFGKSTSDYFNLTLLDPGFRIYFDSSDYMDVPANVDHQFELFESIETGSAKKLERFLEESQIKYETGMNHLVYKKSQSIFEFFSVNVIYQMIRLNALQSFHSYIRKSFSDPRLLKLLEFPILFLGGTARTTPSLYSLMNYSCLKQGTFYPMGGMYELTKAMHALAQESGVEFKFNHEVREVQTSDRSVDSVDFVKTDGVVCAIDYHHFDQKLLSKEDRNYKSNYWDRQTLSPSSLIFYLGIDKQVDGLIHHNLFFDEDFDNHAHEIYHDPKWPEKPLFYVCCPSKTDPSVAPSGKENLFILMPLAPGLKDTPELREQYYRLILARLKKVTGQDISEHVTYKRSYCIQDFEKDYNSYKGNAYGLANTLRQTAMWKPKMKSKKLDNLFFSGQLTVPGPGVPPSIISGQLAAAQLLSYYNKTHYEKYL